MLSFLSSRWSDVTVRKEAQMNFTNVVTYYLDGKPNGVRRCRIEGSVIEAIIIPRESVNDAKPLANVLPKQGIYFLIEDREGVDLPRMYAGQTTNGIGRLYAFVKSAVYCETKMKYGIRLWWYERGAI